MTLRHVLIALGVIINNVDAAHVSISGQNTISSNIYSQEKTLAGLTNNGSIK